MSIQLSRIQETFAKINQFSIEPGHLTRLAYSKTDIACRDLFIEMCQAEGLQVSINPVGAVIARRAGSDNSLAPIAFGSHLDTVVNAGPFDGILGVIGALEVIRDLNERKVETRYPLELIVFACEESSRFNMATLSSKVMAGSLKREKLETLKDADGITLPQAFTECGLNFDRVEDARHQPGDFSAFVELHIEQGPRLEKEKKTIGVVTGIAAPWRLKIQITGEPQHSGATAMGYRHDALLTASELSLAIEKVAIAESGKGTVATTGKVSVTPGVMNTVPGTAEMLVDIRGIHAESRDKVYHELIKTISEVSARRGVTINVETISRDLPVLLNDQLIKTVEQACQKLELSYEKMPSGAGHDAMNMAQLCPTGMIFVPSINGISHNPAENTEWHDIEAGVKVLSEVVQQLAQ